MSDLDRAVGGGLGAEVALVKATRKIIVGIEIKEILRIRLLCGLGCLLRAVRADLRSG